MKLFSRAQRATSVAALALAIALAGCSAQSTSSTPDASSSSTASAPSVTTSGTAAELASSIAETTHFDEDDLSWDASKETTVTLADDASTAAGTNAAAVAVDGNTVTIRAGGTYRVSGKLSDGQLVVAAGEDVVRIVLDNATLTSSTGSAINIQSANEALLFLENGTTNTLSDASSYADTATDAPNAAIYSMADLTVAGSGSLSVNGNYDDGIVTKDGLVLAAGNVTVTAVDEGIKGKDYTVLLDGIYDVTAGGDGIKSTNDADADRGWLLIAGGKLTVASGDDGIKAATSLSISDGSVTVSKSEEGLEGTHIAISGGTVNVTSNDDGINAAGGTSTTSDTTADGAPAGGMGGGIGGGGGMDSVGDFSLDISGGAVTVNAEGDGIDSNGTASVSGGTVVVNGPTNNGNGALDVNGDLTVSGGTILAAGSSGMAVTPSESSTQSGIQATFASPLAAGTVLHVTDSAGTVVATFVTTKATSSMVFSSAGITAGETYTVLTGGTSDATAGLGSGDATGATEVLTAVAGEYTSGGMGGGTDGGPGRH